MSEKLKAKYEKFTTEELYDILYLDTFTDSDSGLDYEEIEAVALIIKQRKIDAGEYVDESARMWKNFKENYLPLVGSDPFSETEDAAITAVKTNKENTDSSSPAEKKPAASKRIWFAPLKWVACFLVVCLTVIGAASITAEAAGYNLWDVIASWGDGKFSFTKAEIPYSDDFEGEHDSLQEALASYGISDEYAPTWLPEGYVLAKTSVIERPIKTIFVADFICDTDHTISVTIVCHLDSSSEFMGIEMNDDGEVLTYYVGEREHFIFSNMDETQIAWLYGNIEGSISGDFSLGEARQIIDSIYE